LRPRPPSPSTRVRPARYSHLRDRITPGSIAVTAATVLIGAGIKSATLSVFLKQLEPSLEIAMFETLEDCALESSEAWSKAGTGHTGRSYFYLPYLTRLGVQELPSPA
jgi:hypothetical protein